MAVKMVPTMGVVVVRDGKRVRPTIGKAFEFTKEERDALLEAQPNSLRKPSNEDDGADEAVAAATTVTGKAGVKPSAETSQAKASGGKKTATANKSDEEASQDEDL